MGLGVELVKRVFSKDRSRSSVSAHQSNERSHGVDKGKWGLTRFKLCGDDFDSVPQEDDLDTFTCSEATVTQPMVEASEATITLSVDEDPQNEQATKAMEDEERGVEVSSRKFLGEEEAAVIIQSAFRGFQARHQHKQIQQSSGSDGDSVVVNLSKVSVCTSTEVQMGDSTENSTIQDASNTMQQRLQHNARAQVLRPKEEWDGSTVSSNISKLRIQNRLEAMTRRERALAYAFSQQLRTCSAKKKAAQNESDEPNVGWSWLERWMAARAPDNSFVGKCTSTHLEPISSDQRYAIIKKTFDVSVEEMESCGSNDVSVCFENVVITSNNTGEIPRPIKNRLKVIRSASQRKTVPTYHHMMQSNNVKATKRDSSGETEKETQTNVTQVCEESSAKVHL